MRSESVRASPLRRPVMGIFPATHWFPRPCPEGGGGWDCGRPAPGLLAPPGVPHRPGRRRKAGSAVAGIAPLEYGPADPGIGQQGILLRDYRIEPDYIGALLGDCLVLAVQLCVRLAQGVKQGRYLGCGRRVGHGSGPSGLYIENTSRGPRNAPLRPPALESDLAAHARKAPRSRPAARPWPHARPGRGGHDRRQGLGRPRQGGPTCRQPQRPASR